METDEKNKNVAEQISEIMLAFWESKTDEEIDEILNRENYEKECK